MKAFPWVVAVVAVGACGLYVSCVHDPWVRKVAALERTSDSLDHVVGTLRQDSARMAAVDGTLRDSIGVLLVTRRQTAHTDTVMIRADSAVHDAVRPLPDSLKPAVWRAVALKDSAIAELMSQRGALMGIIALQNRQIALRDTAIAGLRPALTEALKERDHWRKVARPSWSVRVLRTVPSGLAFLVVGYLLH